MSFDLEDSIIADLLLACYLVDATCAITNIMTTLIFIIVSLLHAFFLVVPCPIEGREMLDADAILSTSHLSVRSLT